MTVLCFSQLITRALCSNPASPTALWVRGDMEGRGEREISFPLLFICDWIFCMHSFSKPVPPLLKLSKAACCLGDKHEFFLVLFRNWACDQNLATWSGAAGSTLRWTNLPVVWLKSCVFGNCAASLCTYVCLKCLISSRVKEQHIR